MKNLLILAALAASLAACVDIRQQQRTQCENDGGRYVLMDEFDDDICILPNGDVYGFDD